MGLFGLIRLIVSGLIFARPTHGREETLLKICDFATEICFTQAARAAFCGFIQIVMD